VLARTCGLIADHLDVVRLARLVLDRTTAGTGETTILALYAPARRQLFAVAAAEPAKPVRYIWESLRTWSSLHIGSSGKGILAFLPNAEREAILAELPDPIPGLKPLPKEALRAQLDEARRQGFVISHGERFEGAAGAAAPVRHATGRVIGDIIVSWPDTTANEDREQTFARAAVAAAAEVSAALGYR
jgi:DNA-binding IclR family transcriptional regulator